MAGEHGAGGDKQITAGTITGTVAIAPVVGGGGYSKYRNIDLKATSGSNVKASAGAAFSVVVANRTTGEVIVKWYNQATAPASTDTPVASWPIPPQTDIVRSEMVGSNYSTGIGLRATTGIADNDNTDPAANGCVINIEYL